MGPSTGPQRPPAAASPGTPTPELETWLKGQLEAMRAQVRAEIAAGQAAAGPAVPVAPVSVAPTRLAAARRNEQPTALVAASDATVTRAAVEAVTRLGFQPRTASDLNTAVKALDEEELAMLVVDESLGGTAAEGPKLLEWANRMPGVRRRGIFVAWIGSDVASLDQGAAFICGANSTIARGDLGRLADVLSEGVEERDKLYRVFNQVLASVQG